MVKRSNHASREITNPPSVASNAKLSVLRLKANKTMLKVLAVVLLAFLISWIPYWVVALRYSDIVSDKVKKVKTYL